MHFCRLYSILGDQNLAQFSVPQKSAVSEVENVTVQLELRLPYIKLCNSKRACRPPVTPTYQLSVYTPMTSLVAILDLKGKPLIQRSYRDDVPSSCIERFLPLVLEIEEEGQQVTPCFSNQGINYMHIRHSNLYRE